MKFASNFILLICLMCGIAESSSAKQWRGLAPMRSTRADVLRTIGKCSAQKEACRFTLGDEDVYILFSSALPSEYRECVAKLPAETVMFVAIKPRKNLKLSELHLERRNLQFFNPSTPTDPRLKGYRSKNGLILSLFKNRVLQMFYIADDLDRAGCSGYYEGSESFVAVPIVHVPLIYSIDSEPRVKAGEILKASASSSMNETLGYTWKVSAGRIIAGQYTKRIAIDTAGLAGQKIIIETEIGDVFGHVVAGSAVVEVLPN